MADGDDREENQNDHSQHNEPSIPQIGDLEIDELGDPENIEQEYLALDSQLTQLDACLDSLEARNDDLVSRLKAFLHTGQTAPSDPRDDQSGNGSSQTHPGDSSGADSSTVKSGDSEGASGGAS